MFNFIKINISKQLLKYVDKLIDRHPVQAAFKKLADYISKNPAPDLKIRGF